MFLKTTFFIFWWYIKWSPRSFASSKAYTVISWGNRTYSRADVRTTANNISVNQSCHPQLLARRPDSGQWQSKNTTALQHVRNSWKWHYILSKQRFYKLGFLSCTSCYNNRSLCSEICDLLSWNSKNHRRDSIKQTTI